ncbi:MAG TPA: cupin domain-containing protein [Candidatus Elarobacter sp.]|jgi:uncharacterized cupin superfamily protein|nr:cupin domain-containing protein [Candidatus Elarobacter sp.]
MRQTVVPGVWSWSRWQPDRSMDFNGFFVESPDGNLVVDPIAPGDELVADLRERGVATVLVTNRDHERATAAVAEATGAQVVASALDAPTLAVRVDRTVVPGDVVHGWTVLGLDGCKTPGEVVLYDRERRAAIVGDAIWGTPAGALTLMPDAKLADPARAALSVRTLRAHAVDHLLVGDGACVFGSAHAALGAMIDARAGVAVNRINVFDELVMRGDLDDPAPFRAAASEVGRWIGAEKLGYQAMRLARGESFCPYHWHTREEELYVVLRGTPSLRTPAGTFALRAGDCVAFVTGPRGAHRISNDDDDEPAIVLAIANTDGGDACFYPDSRKFVVEATGTLVREEPQLAYFEGET